MWRQGWTPENIEQQGQGCWIPEGMSSVALGPGVFLGRLPVKICSVSSACFAGRRDDGWALPASRPGTAEGGSGAPGPAANGGGNPAVATYVRPLAEELERKRALFMDDASFITEVRKRPRDAYCASGSSSVSDQCVRFMAR